MFTHIKPISEPRNILEALHEQRGLWITAHNLRRTMATDIGVEARWPNSRLLVAGAALRHTQGAAGSVSSGATEGI